MLFVTARSLKAKKRPGPVLVGLRCARAHCQGSLELLGQSAAVTKGHEKAKAVPAATVMARGSFSLRAGAQGQFDLEPTTVGRPFLEKATARSPLGAEIVATLEGGSTKKVRVEVT